ncbi:MAG: hypothetical protein Q9227_005560 [Pyrenula ochraceoflavens]
MTTLAPPPVRPSYSSSVRYPSRSSSQTSRLGGFADGLPTPPESKAMTDIYYQNGHPPHLADRSFYQAGQSLDSLSWKTQNSSKPGVVHSQPSNPVKDVSYEPVQKSRNNSIASIFKIPEAIDSSGGSLTELAAEITCLFWFESATTLQNIEQSPTDAPFTKVLAPDTTPTMGFRKWVTTILATTQVTQNVVILALLFIYRLKKSNPQVSGKRGSEFRLLTIALMLGNKFLDDNTYTNKTWAEVSGISVSEIHVMEVEFLSNMRYNLYVSSAEWDGWMVKLGKFRKFLFDSSRVSVQRTMALNSPTSLALPQHKLPSPPSPIHNFVSSFNPTPLPPSQRVSPIRTFPESIVGSRKRSLDASSDEPPAKRAMQNMIPTPVSSSRLPAIYTPGSFTPSSAGNSSAHPRLPMPRIQTNIEPASGLPNSWNNQLPLPNSRAMSSVYPTQPTTPTTVPSNSLDPYHASFPAVLDSTQAGTPFTVRSVHGSPANQSFNSLTPTTRLSPSVFLNNRNSPYRPIRAVNTLLYPPPSASMQSPSRNIPFEQMHYQPLSKQSAERKVGVVPYLHHDPWTIPLQNKVIDLEVAASAPSPTVDPSVHTILIGHSMGGILATDTLLLLANEHFISSSSPEKDTDQKDTHRKEQMQRRQTSSGTGTADTAANTNNTSVNLESTPTADAGVQKSGLMFPYIRGILALDTPFLGINPGVVAYGAEQHYKTASSAYNTVSELGSAFGFSGWGSKSEPALPDKKRSKPAAAMLPATDAQADAAAAPKWQSWGKYAMFAGAAGAIAAGGAAALYSQKDKINMGWSWMTSHLEFVGCLARAEDLKARLKEVAKVTRENSLGFADVYGVLGKGAKEGVDEKMLEENKRRTFARLPPGPVEDGKVEFDGDGLRWVGTVNNKAQDEIGAHMSMFYPRDNPGFYNLGLLARSLLVEWVDGKWYGESENRADGSAGGKSHGEIGDDGWEKPDYHDEEAKTNEKEKNLGDAGDWEGLDGSNDEDFRMRDDVMAGSGDIGEDLENSVIVDKTA